ncbi:MAG: phytanoyl-CoA dioxygenase family protein [Phycisphaeraceae bacterium]
MPAPAPGIAPGTLPAGYVRAADLDRFDVAGFFTEHGFIVVTEALGAAEVAELNTDATDICRGKYGTYGGWLGPHDGESDDDVLRRYLCIHHPHKFSPIMYRALAHRVMAKTLTQVIGPDVKCMQSMLFIKAAGKPGQAWHQDEFYIPTRDRSLTGGWIALDDATIDNGCLWVIPGSHKHGVLWPQHQHGDKRFDCAGESWKHPYTDDDAVPVEAPAGSIVFFNGYLLHRSLPNTRTSGYRRCLVNHYMSASSLLPWFGIEGRGHVAQADFRDIVMIAGHDPYAWKGTEDLAKPHVRPSGEGGCGGAGNVAAKASA